MLRQFGFIQPIETFLHCKVTGEYIPKTIQCDVSKFKLGEKIYPKHLEIPENVVPVDTYRKKSVAVCKRVCLNLNYSIWER